eukprot:27985-Eustigmatos_ZCMA.PRE.1
MQESRVLFIRLNALQNEVGQKGCLTTYGKACGSKNVLISFTAQICKNIVLAGVNVALLDDQP